MVGTNGSKRTSEPLSSEARSDAREDGPTRQKKRGWREIEAWRERKFLRESLAEIWDEDLLVDESLFAGDETDVTIYTDSEDIEVEDELTDFGDEEFYEDED